MEDICYRYCHYDDQQERHTKRHHPMPFGRHCIAKPELVAKKFHFSPPRVLMTSGGLVQQSRPLCPHSLRAGGGSDDLSPSVPAGVRGRLRLDHFAFARNALIRLVCTFDAVFELAPIVWELFGHSIGPTRHIATDCRPEHHALADMEFM